MKKKPQRVGSGTCENCKEDKALYLFISTSWDFNVGAYVSNGRSYRVCIGCWKKLEHPTTEIND